MMLRRVSTVVDSHKFIQIQIPNFWDPEKQFDNHGWQNEDMNIFGRKPGRIWFSKKKNQVKAPEIMCLGVSKKNQAWVNKWMWIGKGTVNLYANSDEFHGMNFK